MWVLLKLMSTIIITRWRTITLDLRWKYDVLEESHITMWDLIISAPGDTVQQKMISSSRSQLRYAVACSDFLRHIPWHSICWLLNFQIIFALAWLQIFAFWKQTTGSIPGAKWGSSFCFLCESCTSVQTAGNQYSFLQVIMNTYLVYLSYLSTTLIIKW